MKRVFYCMLLSFLIYGFGDGAIRGGGNAFADENVQQAISRLIKPFYVCCGNSCFTKISGSYGTILREYNEKIPNIQIITSKLNEADKLNGLEWQGIFKILGGKATRLYDHKQNKWGQWERGSRKDGFEEMIVGRAEKRNGEWEVVLQGEQAYYKDITCADATRENLPEGVQEQRQETPAASQPTPPQQPQAQTQPTPPKPAAQTTENPLLDIFNKAKGLFR